MTSISYGVRLSWPSSMSKHVRMALQNHANYIETGDPLLSANDIAERMASNDPLVVSKYRRYVKVLSDDQRQIIQELRQLANEVPHAC